MFPWLAAAALIYLLYYASPGVRAATVVIYLVVFFLLCVLGWRIGVFELFYIFTMWATKAGVELTKAVFGFIFFGS